MVEKKTKDSLKVCCENVIICKLIMFWLLSHMFQQCTRDDPKALILASYLCNQQCNMPENCTKYKYILCLFTALTSFV